ncbi:uncharacterized protein [Hoplias malabaricus]|uniref:uncharacterized protein n=1 Tax=Hoplias malabaricus TaxID=27720 RepID=UPI0034628DC2
MESYIFGTSELETIRAIRSIEGLSQLCEETVDATGYLNPLGFEVVPGTSAVVEPLDATYANNDQAPQTFTPCLTSSPTRSNQSVPRDIRVPVPQGKRGSFGSGGAQTSRSSSGKRLRLDDIHKTNDLDIFDLSVYEDCVDPGLCAAGWSDELFKTWNDNSFTVKEDNGAAVVPNDVLNDALIEPGDSVTDEIKSNQDHEQQQQQQQQQQQNQVGGCNCANNPVELITLMRQMSQEIAKISIEQRRQAALNRRRDNIIQKQVERIEALCKEQTANANLVKDIHGLCKKQVAHSETALELLYKLNRLLQVLAGDGGVVDITLRGSSLTSDVNTVLSSRDGYSVDRFSDAIERVMQSNNSIKTDESLALTVSIVVGKNGGVRRKVRDLAHDQVETLVRAYGLEVEVMWECQWASAKRDDLDVATFISNYTAPERLKPRDALFGGRTNAYNLYYKAKEGDWEPPLGPYLGDLTDEIGGGDYITEFCSGGPKTYGYLTAGADTYLLALTAL